MAGSRIRTEDRGAILLLVVITPPISSLHEWILFPFTSQLEISRLLDEKEHGKCLSVGREMGLHTGE
jgi:hypothetical protein